MADLIQAPAVRITYPGIDNPLYDSDIKVANQMAISMVMALSGLSLTDFAIIWGIDLVAGVPNTYTPGYFFLFGQFYYLPTGFTEGNYLQPSPVNTQNQGFDDGNSRNIYTVNLATANPVSDPTFSPQFMGTMNQYRMGNKYLANKVISLLATQAALGNAAFRNVGQTAGTVAAGDDPRMPYTASQLAALFVIPIEVILKGDANAYTPTGPNDPLNKNYGDTTYVKFLARGRTLVGDVPSGGTTIGISFGVALANTSYQIHVQIVALSAGVVPADAAISSPAILENTKTTSGISVRLQEAAAGTSNIALDWYVLPA